MKNKAEILVEKLRPNIIPEKLWQFILVDFITKLPVSKSHNSILIVCDRFSKIFYSDNGKNNGWRISKIVQR